MLLRERCQMQNLIGVHGLTGWITGIVGRGLGVRSGLRYLRGPRPGRGQSSAFAEGSYVRVMDPDRIRATLNRSQWLRGLLFTDRSGPSVAGCTRSGSTCAGCWTMAG